jgi:hypothetical protein
MGTRISESAIAEAQKALEDKIKQKELDKQIAEAAKQAVESRKEETVTLGAGAAVRAGTAEAFNLTNFGKSQHTTEKGVWELVDKAKQQLRKQQELIAAVKASQTSAPQQIVSIP